ncbi:hypothetical protein [Actinokineospora sp. NBRC 105648]|uniref:hypothetical protein n=1 Tax=Actinokineospora sp. NBRC 105648 TaxID=3032206 RepID=UPI0024A07681|nr:hypothetical protein [Actinokineospora sp. NBRC 105648]GLZ37947.1 hypothetical protein Acsp05_15710 [Actinokineospora sp. NBRC 105648]
MTDVADLRKVGEDKRITLVISLLHTVRTNARDERAGRGGDHVLQAHGRDPKRGRDHLEALHEAHRAESERLLGVFGVVLSVVREATAVADVPAPEDTQAGRIDAAEPMAVGIERAGRLVFKTLEQADGLEALTGARTRRSRRITATNYLPLLDQRYRSHRPTLFTLLDSIELEATSAERAVLDEVEFIRAHRNSRASHVGDTVIVERPGRGGVPEKVTLAVDVDAFASVMWRKILRDKPRPGLLVRRHLEVCVFSYLAAELRSGDIAVAGSDSFANLHAQLMSWRSAHRWRRRSAPRPASRPRRPSCPLSTGGS